MQRLHLFDDTVREQIDEHDIDDPESCVYPIAAYREPTHYLLTAAEYTLLIAGETPATPNQQRRTQP